MYSYGNSGNTWGIIIGIIIGAIVIFLIEKELSTGDTVYFEYELEEDSNWFFVNVDKIRGWCFAGHLKKC